MTRPFIVFGAPDIGEPEIAEVVATLRSGWLGTGPRVARFESDFAQYKGLAAEHAVAVNSCTAALHLSLMAAGLGPGDEVITTPLTFCATVNAILHTGATPVIVDVDRVSMNITASSIAGKIGPRTKAIVAVHFGGLPCEMDEILALSRVHELAVIEDCAHAIETMYKGRPAGTLGDFGCFSFYVTKNITSGEGGLVFAKNAQDVDRLRRMSLHGLTRDAWKRFSSEGYQHYQVVEPGFKYNMMDLQAAIAIHQLQRVEEAWQIRQKQWARYQAAFSELPLTRPADPPPHVKHAFHLYPVLIDPSRCGLGRDSFIKKMQEQGVGVGVHYIALPDHPFYQERLGWHPGDTPCATDIGRTTVSLPIGPALSDVDLDRIIEVVIGIFAKPGAP